MPAAAEEPVPVPVPADPAAVPAAASPRAPGSIFQNYDTQGGMGGLFAPAYIKGFAPSENAVAAWQNSNRSMTRAMIDSLRMPNPYYSPGVGGNVQYSAGQYPYSGPMPLQQFYGDPRGAVDPESLRVSAQGGKYDFAARRDAIAARLAANAAAAGQPAPAPVAPAPLPLKMGGPSLIPYQDYTNVGGAG